MTLLFAMLLSIAGVFAQEETEESSEAEETSSESTTKDAPPVKLYYSGSVDADFALGLGSSWSDVGHSLDAGITFGASFLDGKVTAEFCLALSSGGDLPAGGDAANADKWTATAAFDGATITVNDVFDGLVDFTIFDLSTSAGGTSYYWLKNTDLVRPSMDSRGIQAAIHATEDVTISASFGFGESGADSTYVGTLDLAVGDMANVAVGFQKTDDATTSFDFISFGGDVTLGDFLKITVGAAIPGTGTNGLSADDMALSLGGLTIHGGLEGGIDLSDSISLAYAVLGGLDTATRTTITGDRFTETLLVYVEPGFTLSDYVSLGVPVEFHMTGAVLGGGTSANHIWVVPTLYFYPTGNSDDLEIWVWGQADIDVAGSVGLYGGAEVIYSF